MEIKRDDETTIETLTFIHETVDETSGSVDVYRTTDPDNVESLPFVLSEKHLDREKTIPLTERELEICDDVVDTWLDSDIP